MIDRIDGPPSQPPLRPLQPLQETAPLPMIQDGPPEQQPQEDRKRPKKRRRVVVSCTECHRRKQKCDRGLPCSNCRSRSKEASCSYDAAAPTARRVEQRSSQSPSPGKSDGPEHHHQQQVPPRPAASRGPRTETDIMSSMAAEWGYSSAGTSTMAFLKTIEAADAGADRDREASAFGLEVQRSSSSLVRDKFKSLIRQLPTRTYLDKLIDIFIAKLNWHYYIVDAAIFARQLAAWNDLPFKTLQAGPQGLPPDLRVFPAVLFQIVATALLSLDERPDPDFDALKYAGNMTFEDLAIEYSEAGAALVNLFGKRDLAVTTVQAEFLRASFLKFTKNVTESWHMIAITIRDAQELGMHKDSMDPKPATSSAEAVLENQWHIEQRRKLYGLLAIWDIHMSLILARPGVMDWRHPLPTPPVDVHPFRDLSRTPVLPRDPERDPPTPIASTRWMLRLLDPLRDILDMEKEGPCPKDFAKVDRIHQKFLDLEEQKPAILRSENPDTRWDDTPELHWLPYMRAYYGGLHQLSLMSLHRPYIFHRKTSREAALSAGISMLEAQRRSFIGLPPHSWRNYHLFFGSFDAIVLISTIIILFPREQTELRPSALQQFQWTIERFTAMQERNPYARSGLGILKAILAKLNRSINNAPSPDTTATTMTGCFHETPSSSTPSGSGGTGPSTTGSHSHGGDVSSWGDGATPDSSSHNNNNNNNAVTFGAANDWSMGTSSDTLASLAPLFPTSDLFFNDLNAVFNGGGGGGGGGGGSSNSLDQQHSVAMEGGDMLDLGVTFPAQFGGGFGEDTVWQYLNQYQPGTSV